AFARAASIGGRISGRAGARVKGRGRMKRGMGSIFKRIVLAFLLGLLAACAQLPSLEGRSVSSAYTDTADTRLGRAIQPLAAGHPGKSGVSPLARGGDAFAARALMAQAAEKSIDIQNYIWHDDMAGTLLF